MSTSTTSPLPLDVIYKADASQTTETVEDPFEVLVTTVNHVFSREYMSHDPTFVAHLDTRNNEFSAPIAVVAELPIIKALTSDLEFMKKALRKAPNVIFDEEKCTCKPTFKLVQRTTLILRDIPITTPEHEVRALFAADTDIGAGIQEARPEVGDNYFITFSNEEVTVRAFNLVRGMHFNGKLVQARIKSESLLKNSYYVDPAVLQLQQQQQQQEALYHDPYANPYGRGRGRFTNNRRGRGNLAGGKDYGQGRKQSGSNGANANRHNTNKRGGASVPGKDNAKQNVALNGPSHWPPLQEKGHSTSGYSGAFKKYSRQQVVSIFASLAKESTPTDSPTSTTATTTATALTTTAATTPATNTTSETVAASTKPTSSKLVAEWLIPTSQLPIFSEQPFTQLEVMNPVKDAKVEFNESKKRKHHEKKAIEDGKPDSHHQPQKQQQHHHQHQPQPLKQHQKQNQSKGYAEAAKSASLNSTG